jgi:hypothetical protein
VIEVNYHRPAGRPGEQQPRPSSGTSEPVVMAVGGLAVTASDEGTVRITLKRAFSDGTTAVDLEKGRSENGRRPRLPRVTSHRRPGRLGP